MNKEKNDMVQKIYHELKYKILTREFTAGDRLIETQLASEYQASRLHVKEALRLLESEHLAEHIPMRGVLVIGITNDTIKEIAELRQALEVLVIKTIMPLITDDFLQDLERTYKRFEAFVRMELIDDCLNEAHLFYEKIYNLCPYKRVIAILQTYGDYIDLIMKLTIVTKEAQLEGIENLHGILVALKAHDLDEAIHQLSLRHKYLSLKLS
ncbi:GntR family transcriptional regulator [Lactonifactor longoviformis]|uniref:GntR family transcriptional regulator n=1 Tax=Lactonifactor longoviformis TaxID=341220 RepID=UPI0036F1ABD5